MKLDIHSGQFGNIKATRLKQSEKNEIPFV